MAGHTMEDSRTSTWMKLGNAERKSKPLESTRDTMPFLQHSKISNTKYCIFQQTHIANKTLKKKKA